MNEVLKIAKKPREEAVYRISLAEYLISTTQPRQKPELGGPEIAFIGRSNVGKSSLINRFVARKGLARVSGSPGKTRTINYYQIGMKKIGDSSVGKEFLLVDLPGYGYAKVSKEERKKWREFVGQFLVKSPELRRTLLLVDIRHDPMEPDLVCAQFLHDTELPFSIVATKADKISKNQIARQRALFAKAFDVPLEDVIVTSAEDGRGRDELVNSVAAWIHIQENQVLTVEEKLTL